MSGFIDAFGLVPVRLQINPRTMNLLGLWKRPGRFAALMLGPLIAAASCLGLEARIVYGLTEEGVTMMQPKGQTSLTAGSASPKSRKEDQLTVILGDAYFEEERADGSVKYDFRSRRILSREPRKGNWTSYPLFSDLGFRLMEYQNRVMLGRALAAGGVKESSIASMGDTFELETLFSLRFPNNRSKPVDGLTRKVLADGTWSFLRNADEVVGFKASAYKVPAQLRATYEKWLIYRSRIHPQIRQKIVEAGAYPLLLRTHWHNTGETGVTTLLMQDSGRIEGSPHMPDPTLDALPSAEGELLKALLSSRDPKVRAERRTLDAAVRLADEAVARGRPLDGLLGLLEIQFQGGGDTAPALQRFHTQFSQDQECTRFISSLGQSSSTECEEGLRTLREIDRKGLTKDYILDVHIGDQLSNLGRSKEAETEFLSVLQRNPLLAGPWNDLGQLYFRRYDMPKAWLCWDAGRGVCPSHPMLDGVTKLEGRMQSDFPEFFMQ